MMAQRPKSPAKNPFQPIEGLYPYKVPSIGHSGVTLVQSSEAGGGTVIVAGTPSIDR
jgi:hypothetical protein